MVAVAFAMALLLVVPAAAHAARDIPIGVHNLNGSRSQEGPSRIFAMRFVLDHTTTVYRFFTGFNMEGVYTDSANRPAPAKIRTKVRDKTGAWNPPAPSNLPSDWTVGTGRTDYAHGNGGTIRARLVPMKADGTPNLGTVLAQDTYNPVARYKEVMAQYPIGDRAGMVYSNFNGVTLQAGRPYFVVYQNIHARPDLNYVSYNSPVVKDSEAGPNATNTLDPNARGAIAGLDPREAVAWSLDTGASWTWGRRVGGGSRRGDYEGSTATDGGTRLPWYAWQPAAGAKLKSNQPWMSYPKNGSPGQMRMTVNDVTKATTMTHAGGYAPVGSEVGVVTVKNLRTGQTGRTTWLGSGIERGALSTPVRVEVGDDYEISTTGQVWRASADQFLQAMGLVGPGVTPYATAGFGYDRAELFATPHPFVTP
jgi:hypothetical protein